MWVALSLLGALLIVIVVCNLLIIGNASGKMFDNVADIPRNRVGLLLGTSPITRWGSHNLYFDERISAAAQLLDDNKIDTVIVSGGNYIGKEKYGCDEPAAMRDSLIARGITPDRIKLDYDGTRTIKSFQNVRNIFGVDSLTIISQKYHNSRALYIGRHLGLNVVAFNAKEPNLTTHKIRNHIREYLARVKLFIDLARS